MAALLISKSESEMKGCNFLSKGKNKATILRVQNQPKPKHAAKAKMVSINTHTRAAGTPEKLKQNQNHGYRRDGIIW